MKCYARHDLHMRQRTTPMYILCVHLILGSTTIVGHVMISAAHSRVTVSIGLDIRLASRVDSSFASRSPVIGLARYLLARQNLA